MATITTTPLSHTCAPGASRSRVWRAGFRPSRDRPRRWSSVFKSLTFNFMICCFVRSSGSRSELDIRVRAERRLLFSFRVDRRFLPLVSVNGRSMRLVCDLKPSFKQSGQHHSKMSELTMQSSSTKQPSRHSVRLWNAKLQNEQSNRSPPSSHSWQTSLFTPMLNN